MSNEIRINTKQFEKYSKILSDVIKQIGFVDVRLKGLLFDAPLSELINIVKADLMTGYYSELVNCKIYLDVASTSFESAEKSIISKDIFSKSFTTSTKSINDMLVDLYKSIKKKAETLVKSIYTSSVAWYGGLSKEDKNRVNGMLELIPGYSDAAALYKIIQKKKVESDEIKSIFSTLSDISKDTDSYGGSVKMGIKAVGIVLGNVYKLKQKSQSYEDVAERQLASGDILGTLDTLSDDFEDTIIGGTVLSINELALSYVPSGVWTVGKIVTGQDIKKEVYPSDDLFTEPFLLNRPTVMC